MIDKSPLQRAIDGATNPVYPSSFAEIKEGFREKYGDRGWIGKLAAVYTGATSGKEYGAARRAIERVNTGQYKDFKKAEYRSGLVEAGKQLDPIRRDVPGQGLVLTVNFTAPEDKGHSKRAREFTISLDYVTATEFVADPNYDFLFDEWFDGGADAYGEDGDYEAENVQVTAA